MLPTISNLTSDTRSAYRALKSFADSRGIDWELRSTRRTCAEQRALYEIGRSTAGRVVTYAQGCHSWHVLGRAFDIEIPGGSREDYQELGEAWERMGGNWGGRISKLDDVGHFEWHPGQVIEDVCSNPVMCEEAVARSYEGRPWFGMFTVAGIAAAAMIYWMR